MCFHVLLSVLETSELCVFYRGKNELEQLLPVELLQSAIMCLLSQRLSPAPFVNLLFLFTAFFAFIGSVLVLV